MKIKIKTPMPNRSVLSEGRNLGMGFALAEKVDKETIQLAQPISPCKDYLNDTLYCEMIKVPFSACGLHSKPRNLFKNIKAYTYLAFQIMKAKNGRSFNTYTGYDAEVALLDQQETRDNIQAAMNKLEEEFGMKRRTKIYPSDQKGIYVAKIPIEWISSTYAISFYCLLFRNAMKYKGEALEDFFFKTGSYFGGCSSAKPMYMKIKKDKEFPAMRVNDFKSCPSNVHNAGAVHYSGIIRNV